MIIKNISKGTVLSDSCKRADSFFVRFVGLMGKKELEPGSGLILTPCNSIHMFFMRFPIDAVFIDSNNKVVYLMENLEPWRISPVIRKAHSVIELLPGTISSSGTELGDTLAV